MEKGHPRDALPSPLGEALHSLRLAGALYCRTELTAPWGIGIPAMDNTVSLLVVTAGRAWLQLSGRKPVALDAGSLTLIPHGVEHSFVSEPGCHAVPLAEVDVEAISDRYEVARLDGGGQATQALYGVVSFESAAGKRLIKEMPAVIKVDSLNENAASWLHSTVKFIVQEASQMRTGGETIITRLADVLVVQAIRDWIEVAPREDRGWLAALRDPDLAPTLKAIADHPGHDWSVESLARIAGLSRSAFSARFSDVIGLSPMRYVTAWRMDLALEALLGTTDTVAAIASRLGYASEASLSRAFARSFGEPPGEARRKGKANAWIMDHDQNPGTRPSKA